MRQRRSRVTVLNKNSQPHNQMGSLQQVAKLQRSNNQIELVANAAQKSGFTDLAWHQQLANKIVLFQSLLHNHVCPFRMENKGANYRKVTDYFPIRRSNRKTKTELKVCMKCTFYGDCNFSNNYVKLIFLVHISVWENFYPIFIRVKNTDTLMIW